MGSPVALTDPTGLKINWGKVFSIAVIAVTTAVTVAGVIASAGGLAVAVGAALSVSSATATTLASAAVAVVAAANVAVGLSDITEVVTEKTNPIRDYVFNGDQEAYDRAKIALSLTTAGMVEVAANAPDVKKKSAPTIEDDYDEPDTQTTVIGGSHGSEIHKQRIDDQIDDMVNSGEYSEIYGNKSLKTAGLNGNQRPDIIGKTHEGEYRVWEFASKSQASKSGYAALCRKVELMESNNPEAKFMDIVKWDR